MMEQKDPDIYAMKVFLCSVFFIVKVTVLSSIASFFFTHLLEMLCVDAKTCLIFIMTILKDYLCHNNA